MPFRARYVFVRPLAWTRSLSDTAQAYRKAIADRNNRTRSRNFASEYDRRLRNGPDLACYSLIDADDLNSALALTRGCRGLADATGTSDRSPPALSRDSSYGQF
jgi:hypothetical protein